MPTSTFTAASSLAALPTARATIAAGGSTRFGAPTDAFASLLDQLGQPPTKTMAAAAIVDDTISAAKPAAVDQPSPAAATTPVLPPTSLLPATSLSPTASLPPTAPQPTAAALDAASIKPDVGAVSEEKLTPKKAATGKASDADALTIAAPVPLPTPELPTPPPAALDLRPIPNQPAPTPPRADAGTSVLAAVASPASPASPPSPLLAPAPTPAPTQAPAPAPAPAEPQAAPTNFTTASTSPTDLSASSRLVGQAAAATQAGLSVDRGSEEDEVPSEPRIGPQQAISAPPRPQPTPPATSPSLTATQLANVAVPPPTAGPTTPSRISGSASSPVRTSEADASSSPSPTLSTAATSQAQPPTSSPADIQAVPPTPPPNPSAAAIATASTRPAQEAPPPSPATQVAQAIVEPVTVMLTSPAQTGPTTPHVTTIQITPAELGRVEVRIERTDEGPAKIQLIAERPETLTRLVHDQSQLQQALDHAGIPQSSRTIEFSLAPAPTDNGAFSTNFLGSNASGGESSSNAFHRQNNAYYNQKSNDPDDDDISSPTKSFTLRTGIDITA